MKGQIGPWVAFLGGLVSFLSPCVLPLVPVYLSLVTGYSVSEIKGKNFSYSSYWLSIFLFILGFTISFVFLGATATAVGAFLNSHYLVLKRAIGIFLVLWALYLLGFVRIPFLSRTFQVKKLPEGRKFTPFLLGVAFGFSWSPCVGAVLVPILSMAALKETVFSGMFLLFCYSLGIALPFVVVSFSALKLFQLFSSFQAHYSKIEKATAVLIFIFGLYLLAGGRL